MRRIAVKAMWIRKTAWTACAAAAVALCTWCMVDNLLPAVRENGGAWALRAAGLTVAPEAEASLQHDGGGALAETPETEADGILSPWAEPGFRPRMSTGLSRKLAAYQNPAWDQSASTAASKGR